MQVQHLLSGPKKNRLVPSQSTKIKTC
jgi:hypothetical protein